jgi:hypothetical protein
MNLRSSVFMLAGLGVGLAGGLSVPAQAQDLLQDQAPPAGTTLINAEIDVSMNIQIATTTPVGSTDSVYCEATISVNDPLTGEWSRTANGVATLISATSYGCTTALKSQVLVPFGWTLGTPTTDTVSITCSAYIGPASGTTIKPFSQTGSFFALTGGIPVPATGKKVPYSCPYAIRL